MAGLCVACALGGVLRIGQPVVAETVSTKAGYSPARLFEEVDGVTLQANTPSPDFVMNGYTSALNTPLIDVKDGMYTKENGEVRRLVSEAHTNGIKATFTKSKTALTFSSVVDISEITRETEIITLLPVATNRGISDVTKMTIRFEDAYNPDNFIAVVMENTQSNRYTTFSAYTDKIDRVGYRYGRRGDDVPLSSTGFATAYSATMGNKGGWCALPEGASDSDYLVEPYTFAINPIDWSLYVRRPGYKNYMVENRPDRSEGTGWQFLCLTDKRVTAPANFFQGFTNNRIKISVTVDGMAGTSADIMLYTINDNALGGETLTDTVAPDLTVDVPYTGIPTATPGREYKLFDYIATDDLIGSCVTTVSIREPDSYDFVKYTGSSFVPTKEGTYTLRYQSIDAYGNTATQEYSVVSSWVKEGLTILNDEPTKWTYGVGETITVPAYTVRGGAGDIQEYYKVFHVASKKEISTEDGQFIPILTGDYEIKYFASDYLGDETNKSVIVGVTANHSPVLKGTLNLNSTFIDGKKVQLPAINAYDYSSVTGAKTNAKLKITVTGNEQTEVIGADRTFTPSIEKFGTDITITYTYYCAAYPEEGIDVPYDCKIKEAVYAADYFDYSKDAFRIAYNQDSKKSFTRFELVSPTTDEIKFINPLYAENLMINFQIQRDYQDFGALRFTFTDKNDASVGFSVDLSKIDASTSTLTYMGEAYTMQGGFNAGSEDVASTALGLGYAGGELLNVFSSKICTIDKNFDGSKFTGFPSNYCKVTMSFVNPGSSAAVSINTISRQNFAASYEDGVLQPFVDKVNPDVVYAYNSITKHDIGDKFTVPMGYAKDSLSDYMEVRVTVQDPLGNVVKGFNNVLCTENLSFVIEEYGYYVISYSTTDAAGLKNNISSTSLYLAIEDTISPTITVDNPNVIHGKVGEKVVLPEVVVLDNYDVQIETFVYVVGDTAEFVAIDLEEGFTPIAVGTYRIVFYAVDENYNAVREEVKLIIGV